MLALALRSGQNMHHRYKYTFNMIVLRTHTYFFKSPRNIDSKNVYTRRVLKLVVILLDNILLLSGVPYHVHLYMISARIHLSFGCHDIGT